MLYREFLYPGHVEYQSEHDGKLDTREFSEGSHAECQIKYSGMVLEVSDTVGVTVVHTYLDPKQALSLLSWLEQEKPTLEKMVGVEKGTSKE